MVLDSLRFACVEQNEPADCGAACLATVARHYGRRLSLGRVRQVSSTDEMGATALGLVEGAEQLGLNAKAVEADEEALDDLPKPTITHWVVDGRSHWVVLHKIGPKQAVVADPARGLRRLSRSEFVRRWTGVLLLVEPDQDFDRRDQDEPIWKRLLRLQVVQGRDLVAAAVAGILYTILGLATAFYVRLLVDRVLVTQDMGMLHLLGAGMVLVVLVRAGLTALRSYFLLYAGQRIYARLLTGYYRHILRLPMRFFDARKVGDLLARLEDSEQVRNLLTGTTATAAIDLIMVLGAGVAMLVFDPFLTAVAFLGVPVFVAVGWFFAHLFRSAQRETMETEADMSAAMVDALSEIETVKTLAAEDTMSDRLDEETVSVLQASWHASGLGITATTVSGTLTAGITLAVLWIGGGQVIQGNLSVGALMGFHALVTTMFNPLRRLIDVGQAVQDGLVAAERLWEVLDVELETKNETEKISLDPCRGDVDMRDVDFSYGARKPVLQDVSFRIAPGEAVALVGESGSGKSTIVNLIQRFYSVDDGRVLLDGLDLETVSLRSLRREVMAVPQEPELFRGTVLENIALGDRSEPDMERAVDAARKAAAHEFIAELPDGYLTEVREGRTRLSAGERQRIGIARVLYEQPAVLLLDEVTSALDSHAEERVKESLQSLHGHVSMLVVAHRMSTITFADRIIVLEDGRVVESGTHQELMDGWGAYRDLWERQVEQGAVSTTRSA